MSIVRWNKMSSRGKKKTNKLKDRKKTKITVGVYFAQAGTRPVITSVRWIKGIILTHPTTAESLHLFSDSKTTLYSLHIQKTLTDTQLTCNILQPYTFNVHIRFCTWLLRSTTASTLRNDNLDNSELKHTLTAIVPIVLLCRQCTVSSASSVGWCKMACM